MEHATKEVKKIINDKIIDVRLSAYKEIGSLLDGFSIENLEKFESQLTVFLLNGLR